MDYFGHAITNPFRNQNPAGFYHPVKGHTGIDIGTPIGTELSLPIATEVALVNTQSEMGLTLYLRDSSQNILVFSHLDEVLVEEGEALAEDQIFARTGASGSRVTGPHLHFEVIAPEPGEGLEVMIRELYDFSGYNIDPTNYLDRLFETHWSDEAMAWALEQGLISQERHHSETPTWGELVVVLKRLAEKCASVKISGLAMMWALSSVG